MPVATQLLHDARLVEINAGSAAPEHALDLMRAMQRDIEKSLTRAGRPSARSS